MHILDGLKIKGCNGSRVLDGSTPARHKEIKEWGTRSPCVLESQNCKAQDRKVLRCVSATRVSYVAIWEAVDSRWEEGHRRAEQSQESDATNLARKRWRRGVWRELAAVTAAPSPPWCLLPHRKHLPVCGHPTLNVPISSEALASKSPPENTLS